MNEQALKDSYELFKQKGYTKSFDEYVNLINTNPDALNDSYTLFKEKGYEKSIEDFSTLVGVKKKDESVSTVQEDVTESITPTEQEEVISSDVSVPIQEARPQSIQEQEVSVVDESVPTDFTPEPQNINLDFSDAEFEQGEKDTALERTFGKNVVTDLFGDLYRAGAAGQAQGGSVDESLELFAKGADASDEDIQDFIAAQKRMQDAGESDEMRDFQKIYQKDGGGVLGFIKGVAANPTVIPQLFVSSVSAMLTPAVLAGAATGAGAGALAGSATLTPFGVGAGAIAGAMGGAGTALEAGLTYSELLQEQLGDKPMTNENIREVLQDEEMMDDIRFKAVARGLTIGAVDAAFGGVASKLTTSVAKSTGRKLVASAAGGATEAVGGSVGEIAGRVAAGQEMDVAEILFEGVAGTATAPISVGYGLYKSPKYKINGTGNEAKVSGPMMAKFLRESTPEQLLKADINIENDSELQSIYDEKFKEANIKNDILSVDSSINEPTLNAITELQVELNNLEGNKTQFAKDKAAEIKANIKSLQDNPITEGEARETDITVDGDAVSTTTNVVTEEFAVDALNKEGVSNPTTEQIQSKKEQLLKEQADAIQEPSTETVDAQEQTGDSQTVGERDPEVSELTTETTQEVQESDVETEVDGEPRFRLDGLETEDQNLSEIVDEMNKMDEDEQNFTVPTGDKSTTKVNPIEESNSTTKLSEQDLVDIGVENESDLVKPISYFDGIPMITGISDILAAGTVKDAVGKAMEVAGGIMFNVLGKNKKAAWAGVERSKSQTQYNDAVTLYNNNKATFDKLWADGKLPQGHVPMAIVRMGNTAVNSNEAALRYLAPEIKSKPIENQQAALNSLIERLNTTKGKSHKSILKFISKNNITDLGSLLDAVSVDASNRAKGDVKKTLSLDSRAGIFTNLTFGIKTKKVTKSPDGSIKNPILRALYNNQSDKNSDVFLANNIYNALGEPSMMKANKGDVVSVVGVDVLNGGVIDIDHGNYGTGPKGRVIALIENPTNGIDVFPTWRAKASRIFKKDISGKTPNQTEVSNQTMGTAANDAAMQGDTPKVEISNLDILIGKLKFAFPSVNVATSQVEFDAIINQPGVRTQESNGKTILGLTKDGKIFINPAFDSLATPIHEFGHIWTDFLRSDASGKKGTALLARGLKLVEGTDALKAAIEKYGDTKLAREEALVELMATKGETITNAAQESKFKEWMNATFKYIKQNFTTSANLFGKQEIDAINEKFKKIKKKELKDGNHEPVAFKKKKKAAIDKVKKRVDKRIKNLTLEEFIDTGLADLFSGKRLDVDASENNKFDAKAEAQSSKARFEVGKDVKATIKEALALGMSDKQIEFTLKQRGLDAKSITEAMAEVKEANKKIKGSKIETTVKGGMKMFDIITELVSKYEKTGKRGKSFQAKIDSAVTVLQSTPAYIAATDVQKETAVRDLRKKLGAKETTAPSVKRVLGIKKGDQVTLSTADGIIQGIRDAIRGGKDMKKFILEAEKNLAAEVGKLVKKGNLTNSQAQRILKRFAATDVTSEAQVDRFVDYMENVYNKSEGRLKKSIIQDIAGKVNDAVKKSKSFDPETAAFFNAMQKVLAMAIDNKTAAQIKDKLFSDIDTLLEQDFDSLTPTQKQKVYAYESLDSVKDINDMTLEQLESLLNDVQEGKKGGRSALQLRKEAFRAEVKETKKQADKDINDGYSELYNEDGTIKGPTQLKKEQRDIESKIWRKGLGKAISEYVGVFDFKSFSKSMKAFKNSLTYLGTLTNGLDKSGTFFTDNIYKPLNRAVSNYTKGLQVKRKKFDSIAKTITGINSYADIKNKLYTGVHTLSGIKEKGKDIGTMDFSANELMRILALSKNEVQRKKLLTQGFTEEKIEEIKVILGKEVVEFVDKTVEYLSTEYYNETNEVYRDVNDSNLSYIENYFPTKTHQEKTNSKMLEDGDFRGIQDAQFADALKDRDNTEGEIDLNANFTEVLDNHIDSMERFKAYAPTVKKLAAIMNFPAVKVLLEQAGLTKAVKNAINMDVNPGSYQSALEPSILDKLQTKYTSFSLALKIMQIPKQATSFVNAYEDYSYRPKGQKKIPGLDAVMFMVDAANLMVNFRSNVKRAWEMSPMLQERLLQGLEGDVHSLESGGLIYKESGKPPIGKIRQALKTAAAAPTVIGDVMGVMGYMINYNRDIANGMSEVEAMEKFEDYNATQQTRRGTEKIPLQMAKSPYTRAFTMFGSTLFLQMNKVMQSYTNITRAISKKEAPSSKDVRALFLNLGVANVLFAVAANAAKMLKGDEEDREEVLQKMGEAMVGMNQIYKIPMLGTVVEEIANKAKGVGSKPVSDVVNPLGGVYQKIKKISKGVEKGDYVKVIGNTTRGLLEFAAGVQFDPFIGLARTATGDFSEENVYDMLGVSPSYRPKGKSAKQIKEDKLGQYDNETDMKRYNKKLWNKTFGPESEGYLERKAIKDAKSAERKAKRTEKDAKYKYEKSSSRRKSKIRGRGGESGRSSSRGSGR
tara:strand:- start:20 stop:7522 length:7503 start_codon:yes stop_codon:yes gene_type:complete